MDAFRRGLAVFFVFAASGSFLTEDAGAQLNLGTPEGIQENYTRNIQPMYDDRRRSGLSESRSSETVDVEPTTPIPAAEFADLLRAYDGSEGGAVKSAYDCQVTVQKSRDDAHAFELTIQPLKDAKPLEAAVVVPLQHSAYSKQSSQAGSPVEIQYWTRTKDAEFRMSARVRDAKVVYISLLKIEFDQAEEGMLWWAKKTRTPRIAGYAQCPGPGGLF